MNINLSGAKKKQQQGKGKSLGFGLNKRKKASTNVFDSDDDNDEEEEEPPSQKTRRDKVNQEIAAEQEALRKRAKKAMSAHAYDYDGSYDDHKAEQEQQAQANKPPEEKKKSRYIQDLLKQSEKRAIEREAVYERKVAREQAEEDAQADYRGKEKFVTNAYKRKLEERQKMAAEDAKQQAMDEKEDVTKRTGGAAMASFYGNLNKNVAMGGGGDKNNKQAPDDDKDKKDADTKREDRGGFKDGFERSSQAGGVGENDTRQKPTSASSNSKKVPTTKEEQPLDPVVKNRAMRKAREEKLAKARIRYFERNGMPIPTA